ncbi:tellurite resistance TerB family protein [Geoalkalibacter sp.]|uniref:tellurite resistance TerB family protein n=1 Tax=Geoalkalibacter sp. TaxID=3041440 RepID=UPI00272DCC48|nr:TerB family tellurite resistance protein [Geoalkalibacter sp.]
MVFDVLKKLLRPAAVEQGEARNVGEPVQVATCVLLLEAAHADERLREVELRLVENILSDKFALSPQATAELMDLAERVRRESFDLYQFTREVNENFSGEQKLAVLENLWRVIYADGHLDSHEEALMRQLTSLLRLSHRQMIEAKLRVQRERSEPDGAGL